MWTLTTTSSVSARRPSQHRHSMICSSGCHFRANRPTVNTSRPVRHRHPVDWAEQTPRGPGTPPPGMAGPLQAEEHVHRPGRRWCAQGLLSKQARAQPLRESKFPNKPRFPWKGGGRSHGICAFWQPLQPGAVPGLVFLCTWLPSASSQRPWQARLAGLEWDRP